MRGVAVALLASVLTGCHSFTMDADGRLAQRAPRPEQTLVSAQLLPPVERDERPDKVRFGDVLQLVAQNEPAPLADRENKLLKRLEFKEGILGLKIPDIKMPSPKAPPAVYEEALKKQFPALPTLPALPDALPGPDGRPLTLPDLQQLALRTNPKIRQAQLQIDAARGLALQAGFYPNPNITYEGSSIGQGNGDGQRSPGQQGGGIEQTIVTMGKKTIARQAALQDVNLAQEAYRQTEAEVLTQVRTQYFAVLAARENHRVTQGLTELTDELYAVMLLQMRVGEAAAYEPMQIRVLALQARGTLNAAQNRYLSAWRQLAAALGSPRMPLTALDGRIDMPVPHFDHDKTLAYVLANHTDMISAQIGIDRHRLLVRLAEVQAFPDVTLHTSFQRDFTTPPYGVMANVNVSIPFPLFDRNHGNIQAARALLRKAVEEDLRVRNDLTAKTAEVFERYDNNRKLLEMYRQGILLNQVQAFRAALARHALAGGATYNDVVTSQQTLATLINSYLAALNDQWTAVIDIANLMQTSDLLGRAATDEITPIPDVPAVVRDRRLR